MSTHYVRGFSAKINAGIKYIAYSSQNFPKLVNDAIRVNILQQVRNQNYPLPTADFILVANTLCITRLTMNGQLVPEVTQLLESIPTCASLFGFITSHLPPFSYQNEFMGASVRIITTRTDLANCINDVQSGRFRKALMNIKQWHDFQGIATSLLTFATVTESKSITYNSFHSIVDDVNGIDVDSDQLCPAFKLNSSGYIEIDDSHMLHLCATTDDYFSISDYNAAQQDKYDRAKARWDAEQSSPSSKKTASKSTPSPEPAQPVFKQHRRLQLHSVSSRSDVTVNSSLGAPLVHILVVVNERYVEDLEIMWCTKSYLVLTDNDYISLFTKLFLAYGILTPIKTAEPKINLQTKNPVTEREVVSNISPVVESVVKADGPNNPSPPREEQGSSTSDGQGSNQRTQGRKQGNPKPKGRGTSAKTNAFSDKQFLSYLDRMYTNFVAKRK